MTGNKRWPDREVRDAEIFKRNALKQTMARISQEMGIKDKTVERVLRSSGIDPRVNSRQRRLGVRKELSMSGPALAQAYLDGATIEGLADQCGVGAPTIRSRLYDEGVTLRRQGSPKDLPEARIEVDYLAGMSIHDLHIKYGASSEVIKKRLLDRGVALRPRCKRVPSGHAKPEDG